MVSVTVQIRLARFTRSCCKILALCGVARQFAAQSPVENLCEVLVAEMRKLQSKIRSECRDVGDNFAEEARKIHYGETGPEGIYGKATAEEREALDEEGIAVVDMPWLPRDN